MTWNIILILDSIQCINLIDDTIFRRLNGTDKILFSKVLTFPEKPFEKIHYSEVLPTNYEVYCKGRKDGYEGLLLPLKHIDKPGPRNKIRLWDCRQEKTSSIVISVSCTYQQIMMKFMHMLLRTLLSISAVNTPRTPYGGKIPSQETNTKR